MLKIIILLSLIFMIALSCNSKADLIKVDASKYGKLNANAPLETEQLGQLAGIWNAKQTIRNKDGKWLDKKNKAIWEWHYILNGHAIQDNWIAVDSSGNQDIVGSNIRIYNIEEKQWYMAWIDKTNRRLATFTAVNENGNIIMTGNNAKGRNVRNTFYSITEKSFDWKQEWTNDNGKTWFTVTKIQCRRSYPE